MLIKYSGNVRLQMVKHQEFLSSEGEAKFLEMKR